MIPNIDNETNPGKESGKGGELEKNYHGILWVLYLAPK